MQLCHSWRSAELRLSDGPISQEQFVLSLGDCFKERFSVGAVDSTLEEQAALEIMRHRQVAALVTTHPTGVGSVGVGEVTPSITELLELFGCQARRGIDEQALVPSQQFEHVWVVIDQPSEAVDVSTRDAMTTPCCIELAVLGDRPATTSGSVRIRSSDVGSSCEPGRDRASTIDSVGLRRLGNMSCPGQVVGGMLFEPYEVAETLIHQITFVDSRRMVIRKQPRVELRRKTRDL